MIGCKLRHILFIVLAIIPMLSNAETLHYHNVYKGVEVGNSTLADVMSIHGNPKDVKKFKDNARYYFFGFDINVSDYKQTVNSIVIFDQKYRDANNIKVGFPIEIVENQFKQPIKANYFVDKLNGIIYWFDNGLIVNITLASELNF